MFNCNYRDQYGSCRKHSTLDVDVPCPENGDCDDFVEKEVTETWNRRADDGKEKRLIDANDLWQKTFICEEPGDFRKAIENAPTVDAVEVVRCKECTYLHCHSAVDRMFFCNNPKGLKGMPNIVEGNPFCSYGERREGE